MALNEAFLDSATVRDNIVSHAKLLNYVPTSTTASIARISFTVQTTVVNGSYPSTLTLKKGPAATGGGFVWNVLDDITVNVNASSGIAEFTDVDIREGNLLTYSYVVDNNIRTEYEIPSSDVDMDTLVVRVRPNEASTNSDLYNKAANITDIVNTTRIYYPFEAEDKRFKIRFGDNVIGRKLIDGEVVDLEYLIASGSVANEVTSFSFKGTLLNNFGTRIPFSSTSGLKVQCKSQLGDSSESVDSIKYMAPRYYATQNRAVTSQDYAVITKKIYNNVDSVVAFGGDLLNPPVYGKVYIAIKTKTGSELNDATKKDLSNRLRDYAMASIDPVVINPDNLFVVPRLFVQYDPAGGSSTSDIQSQIQSAVKEWGSQTQINNFNSTFRNNSFQRAVSLANKSISDVSTQTSVLVYIEPQVNQTNTYTISTGSPLYDSNPSNTGSNIEGDGAGGTGTGTGGTGAGGGSAGVVDDTSVCYKEPILLSGTFRTSDRPGIDQRFEDDGFGRLRIFYNTGTKKVYTNDNAGTVNYETGTINFGPISIIGTGGNLPQAGAVSVSDATTGAGRVIDRSLLPTSLQIPVQIIPADISAIPAATPATSLNIISPDVTVQPLGSETPPTIPLNSLTPTTFDQTETRGLEFRIAGERSLPRVVVNFRESISHQILRHSRGHLAGFERKKTTGSRVVGTCQKWHCSPHRGMGHRNADRNEVDGKFGHATTP